MFVHIPDHFSSKLHYDFKKKTTSVTDRTSRLWGGCGFFFGLLLLWLGCFELFSFFKAEKVAKQSFLSVEIFAVIIILLSLGLIFYSMFAIFRYKKFSFDGESFQIIYRPTLGVKHVFTEPLSNYVGVRLRVLFVQSGLFNKNRYIIDLYNQDNNKIVPLYISTKSKNIRKIWEGYAKMFKMPALSVGDRGMVQREYEDLDKSLKELYTEGKLPYIAGGQFPAPENLVISEKKDSTFISPKGVFWDTFSALFLFISAASTLLLVGGGVYLTIIGTQFSFKYWLSGGILLIAVIYFTLNLFKSYTLVINKNTVAVLEGILGSFIKQDILNADDIENVELSYNPTINRYSLTIISDDKLITFKSRLPVSDLMWLKDFVVRKLIGN